MPIYEYKCDNGHVFDVMQRMSDDPLTACQVCEAPARRVLHAPAVHFKGSGFYNTDYGTKRRQREKEGASSGSGESSSAGSENGSGGSTTTASPEKKSGETTSTASSGSSTSSSSSSKSSGSD